MINVFSLKVIKNQRGVSAIIIAICLVMIVGFIALSVDVSHLVVAKNELQNAADAGALAGARFLYTDDGQAINIGCNQIAFNAAVANKSENLAVEVNWTSGNLGDVQRGHWSFGLGNLSKGFYPNDSTAPVALWGATTVELDENLNFINAVKVTTRREDIKKITSFFSGIFGQKFADGIIGSASAVAYIGYAGALTESTIDAPIAICEEKLVENNDEYNCNFGRFINDSAGQENEETGLWTSLNQGLDTENPLEPTLIDDPCSGGTNANELKPLIPSTSACTYEDFNTKNTYLYYGKDMAVNNGQIDSVYNAFYKAWECNTEKKKSLKLRLPVVKCSDDPTTCAGLVGAVEIEIIWMTQGPNYKDIPEETMVCNDKDIEPWTRDNNMTDEQVWNDFAGHFGLVMPDNLTTASYFAKTIYFRPVCDYQPGEGMTGGKNFGVLAKIPVLVD